MLVQTRRLYIYINAIEKIARFVKIFFFPAQSCLKFQYFPHTRELNIATAYVMIQAGKQMINNQ